MTRRIRVEAFHGPTGLVFRAELPPGTAVLVDADAVPVGHRGEVSARVCAANTSHAEAAQAVAAAAVAILEAAAPRTSLGPGHGTVVHGEGALAALLRSRLGAVQAPTVPSPAVVVDLTGRPESVGQALRQLDDLGTLVLVAGAPRQPIVVDPYPHLHQRGLVVRGLPGLEGVDRTAQVPEHLVAPAARLAEELQEVRVGETVRAAAPWFLVVRAASGDDEIDPPPVRPT